jgi:REP element-mobilizing transposase RayT
VHVTLRVQPGIGYLRAYRRAKLLEDAFRNARVRYGMRIVHYSIQGNHLHLLVEVDDAEALGRGMQGLAIRIAKRLNALIGRRGAVFADRYHSRALETRREVANAMRYVLNNYRKHSLEHMPPRWDDPWSSARFLNGPMESDAPVMPARTWLLRVGWRGTARATVQS